MSQWLTRARRSAGAAAVIVGLLAAAACSSDSDKNTDAENTGDTEAPAATDSAFPRTVEHAAGSTEIPEQPKTVVALDMAFVDAALALETEVVGFAYFATPDETIEGYQLFGEDAAAYGADAVSVGGLGETDFEKVKELDPDLILTSFARNEDDYETLSKIAPTVYTETTGGTWKENITLVGEALGKEELAQDTINAYETRATAIGDAVRDAQGANPTVSLVRFTGGQTVRLYKQDTYTGIIVDDLGFGVPEDAQGTGFNADISQEEIAKLDADRIFVAAYPDPEGASEASKAEFQANELWGRLDGEITEVNDITWFIAVGVYGANIVLDDIAAAYGVDAAR